MTEVMNRINRIQATRRTPTTASDSINSEQFRCNFKIQQPNQKTYIFGDIEGNNKLFHSTLNIIHETKNNDNINYIFLGDLYDYNSPSESIAIIEKIMSELNIPINPTFNNETKEIDVIRSFRKLWKLKQMKCYSKFNIQYIHSKLKPETIPNSKYLFILGNKEIIFVQEIITSEHITKSSDSVFNVPADYKYKHKKPGRADVKHTEYKFTIHQLNTLYSFIMLCNNYAIINKTLFIHCYINYKTFNDNIKQKIKYVISGHSKGYGHFIDSEFKGVEIYIVDLTNQETNNEEEINNYITLTSSGVNYSFNNIIKPKLEKLETI